MGQKMSTTSTVPNLLTVFEDKVDFGSGFYYLVPEEKI